MTSAIYHISPNGVMLRNAEQDYSRALSYGIVRSLRS